MGLNRRNLFKAAAGAVTSAPSIARQGITSFSGEFSTDLYGAVQPVPEVDIPFDHIEWLRRRASGKATDAEISERAVENLRQEAVTGRHAIARVEALRSVSGVHKQGMIDRDLERQWRRYQQQEAIHNLIHQFKKGL